MKKIFYSAVLLVLVAASCEFFEKPKDDKPYYINVNGQEHELNNGLFENYGKISGTNYYNVHLSLYSSGLTVYSTSGSKIDSIKGIGDVIYFEIVTSSGTIIDDGEYSMSSGKGLRTYSNPRYVLGWRAPQTGTYTNISEGVLSFLRTGNVYEIKFDGLDEFGLAVTAYYKGTLKYFNYSS